MNDPSTCLLSGLQQPLKIYSRILQTDLWVVPPDFAGQSFDAPVYTVAECRILSMLALAPAELRALHLSKTLFEGELALPANADRPHWRYQRLLQRYQTLQKQLDDQPDSLVERELRQVTRQLSRLLARAESAGQQPAPEDV